MILNILRSWHNGYKKIALMSLTVCVWVNVVELGVDVCPRSHKCIVLASNVLGSYGVRPNFGRNRICSMPS